MEPLLGHWLVGCLEALSLQALRDHLQAVVGLSRGALLLPAHRQELSDLVRVETLCLLVGLDAAEAALDVAGVGERMLGFTLPQR